MDSRNIVVYLDDDKDDRELLQDAFSATDAHQLICFSEAKDLHTFLSQHKNEVCLIVLDINLPIINGIDVLRQIKSSSLYDILPVVMFTTGANSPQAKQLNEMDIEVIEKPSTYQDMEDVVSHLNRYCLQPEEK